MSGSERVFKIRNPLELMIWTEGGWEANCTELFI